MSLNDTPRANRLHIAVFGRTNSGKSSLINAVTNQQISIVSHIEGTTTDPVYKTMELNPIGPVVWIDTAGFDDTGSLGKMRVEKTNEVTDKTDIALILFTSLDFEFERRWIELFKKKKTPVIAVINKIDEISNIEDIKEKIQREFSLKAVCVSAKEKKGIDKLRDALTYMIPEDFEAKSITRDMCREGDLVLLVMPQDIQAPKGRLILPQVQTLRELLDKKCSVMSVTTDKLDDAFKYMSYPPKLIITDSQVFDKVYEKKPKESALTSFSV